MKTNDVIAVKLLSFNEDQKDLCLVQDSYIAMKTAKHTTKITICRNTYIIPQRYGYNLT